MSAAARSGAILILRPAQHEGIQCVSRGYAPAGVISATTAPVGSAITQIRPRFGTSNGSALTSPPCSAARDAAVARLPEVVVATRAGADAPAELRLETAAELHDISSTAARDGRRDLMAPEAARRWPT